MGSARAPSRSTMNQASCFLHQPSARSWVCPSPNSHQSQGSVERFHRTLFAHIRTIRIGLAINLRTSPSDLPENILQWIIYHATWVLNRYQVHQHGFTSYMLVWGHQYQGHIAQFGEKVMATVE
eukprot:730150-Amphidinium_carterae.1